MILKPLRKMFTSYPVLLLLLAFLLASTIAHTSSASSPALTQNTPSILLADSFSDNNFTEWTVIDAVGALSGPSNWSVRRNKGSRILAQTSNIYTNNNYEGTYVYAGEASWQNYHLNVDVNPDDNDSVFVLFRYNDTNNYYRFIMNQEENFRRLEKKVNGNYTTLAEIGTASYGDGWVNIQILTLDNALQVKVNYETVFSVNDSSFATGKVALGTSASTDCFFDNVVVSTQGIDPFADAIVSSTILQGENEYTNPIEALGPPRHALDYFFDFVSLGGPGYSAVFDLGDGEQIVDGPGNDLRVYELGVLANGIDEEHNVYVSNAPAGPWILIGQGIAVSEFDLATAGVSSARYVRIEDVSTRTDGTATPGSDIDSIQALHMATDTLLVAPTDIRVAINGSTVQVSWSIVNEAVGYNVYRGTREHFSLVNQEMITDTTYSFNLNSGRNEYFAVTAVSRAGYESALSSTAPNRAFLPLLRK